MQTSIPGVYAINSAQILKGNLNVNETIQVAEDAMRTVLAPALASAPTGNQIEPAAHESNDVEAARELVARS